MSPLMNRRTTDRPRRRPAVARRLLASVSVVAFVLGPGGTIGYGTLHVARPAQAATGLFSDLAPLSDSRLARHRGGFSVGALDISIGVNIDTAVDGAVQVSTNYSVEQSGKLTKIGTTVKTATPDDMIPDTSQIVDESMPDTDTIVKEATPDTDAIVQDALGKNDGKDSGSAVAANTGNSAAPQTDLSSPPAPDSPSTPKTSDSQAPDMTANAGPTAESSKPAPAKSAAPKTGDLSPKNTVTADASSPSKTPDPVDVEPTFDDQMTQNPVTETAAADTRNAANTGTTTKKTAPASPASTPAKTKTAASAPANSTESSRPTGTPQPTTTPTPGKSKTPDVETTVTVAKRTAPEAKSKPDGTGGSRANPMIEALEQARIVHRTSNGHLSVLENTLNNISIRQATAINVTVENFTRVRSLSEFQESLSTMARDAAISSLRR